MSGLSKIDTAGRFRILTMGDEIYVVGRGMVIPVNFMREAEVLLILLEKNGKK